MSEGEEDKLKDVADDFSALSNPIRLKLLMKVHEKGSCALKELVDEVQRDESTVKRYVKELIERGFVARSGDRKPKYYITDKGVLALTFFRVKAEPAIMRKADEKEILLRRRGEGVFSRFLYGMKRIGVKKAISYSFSAGCAIMGLLGLLAFNVELFYRILWLLMWLVIAYVFKVLAS